MTNQLRDIQTLWETHSHAEWPRSLGSKEGELMMIDTVVSGCVTYYLESEDGLDDQRIEILESCLTDINNLVPELEEPALPYFERLFTLGHLLLDTHRQ